jgi:hypothetical protein
MRSIIRLRRRRIQFDRTFAETVVPLIWGLDAEACTSFQVRAYQDHYNEVCRFTDDHPVITEYVAIISLVKTVRSSSHLPVRDILAAIEKAEPPCLREEGASDEDDLKKALVFACKMWLFLDLDFTESERSLKYLVAQKFDAVGIRPFYSSGPRSLLSKDFSQKSFERKAGIRLIWTSDLSQHLELVGQRTIKVFRLAGALAAYDEQGSE